MKRLLLLALFAQAGWAGDLSLNLYGLSYHWERDVARSLGQTNEFNPGLGLRRALTPASWCNTPFTEAGLYRDSARNTAVYAGVGCKGFKLTDSLFLGGELAAFHSKTYNDGDPFIAPVPMLIWQGDKVTVNLLHFPKIKGVLDINTTGMYVSLPIR